MSDLTRRGVSQVQLSKLAARAENVLAALRTSLFDAGTRKTLDLRFTLKSAARMAKVSEVAIQRAGIEATLPATQTENGLGGRKTYTLGDVNRMREHFGTSPHRPSNARPAVIAVQNFKGGVGKSTLVTHLAQFFALEGYRVCVIDCDSQASTTSTFGLNPDIDIDEETDTLFPFFRHGGPATLDYALHETYWPGISLIPANLGLYDAEYEFAARMVRDQTLVLDRLRDGVGSIADDFDIILLDPPPALGMISLSVLRAADGLIIPAPPNTIDFASTAHFLKMMAATLEEIARWGGARDYAFVKILASKVDSGKSAHVAINRMMSQVFPGELMDSVFGGSAEIDNAAAGLRTVYEITGPAAHTSTHRRCRAQLDAIGRETEALVRQTWSIEQTHAA